MPHVMEIEAACHQWDMWTEDEFLDVLRRRNVIGMVAEFDGVVVGFMVYELNKHDLFLMNLCVQPAMQRTGIGTAMIDRLKEKLSAVKRSTMELIVSERNLACHLFLRDLGFLCTETIRYPDDDDNYRFVFDITAKPVSERLLPKRRDRFENRIRRIDPA